MNDETQSKTMIMLGQHALERFNERFPELAKEIGFNEYWLDYSEDDDKQFNMFLLYELFKRGKENHTIKNHLNYVINACERHGVNDIGNLKLFTNGNIIFIAESCKILDKNKQEQDKIIIRTVMPSHFKSISRYIPPSDLKTINYEDVNNDYYLGAIKDNEFKKQVFKLMTDPQYEKIKEKLDCDRFQEIVAAMNEQELSAIQPEQVDNVSEHSSVAGTKLDKRSGKATNPTNIDLSIVNSKENKNIRDIYQKEHYDKESQEIQKALSMREIIQTRLDNFGLKYVKTLDNGVSLLYCTDQYVGTFKNKNKLMTITQRRLQSIISQPISSYDGFNAHDMDELFYMRDIHSNKKYEEEIYIGLLMNCDSTTNSTFLSISELKEAIQNTIPEDLRLKLKVNSKTLSDNVLNNFQHYLFKTDIGLELFMGSGLMQHDIRDNFVIVPYAQTNKYALCFCKNKTTDEFTLAKYPFFERNRNGRTTKELAFHSEKMDSQEYWDAIEKFCHYFDQLTQQQKKDTALWLNNEQSSVNGSPKVAASLGVSKTERYEGIIDDKAIYQFVANEINKFNIFDNKISQIIEKYNLPLQKNQNGEIEVVIPQLIKHDELGEQKIVLQKNQKRFFKK